MKARHLRADFAAIAVAVTLLLAACRDAASPSAPRVGLPAEYSGSWYLAGTSGGIDGREVAVADGSWIVITPERTIEHYAPDGRLVSTEAFEPTRGRSIFSGDDAWILGGPDSIERVIAVQSDGVLTISENVYDGFGSTYTRRR